MSLWIFRDEQDVVAKNKINKILRTHKRKILQLIHEKINAAQKYLHVVSCILWYPCENECVCDTPKTVSYSVLPKTPAKERAEEEKWLRFPLVCALNISSSMEPRELDRLFTNLICLL